MDSVVLEYSEQLEAAQQMGESLLLEIQCFSSEGTTTQHLLIQRVSISTN